MWFWKEGSWEGSFWMKVHWGKAEFRVTTVSHAGNEMLGSQFFAGDSLCIFLIEAYNWWFFPVEDSSVRVCHWPRVVLCESTSFWVPNSTLLTSPFIKFHSNKSTVGLSMHGNHVIFLWSKLGKSQKHSSHLILWKPVGVKLTLLCGCPVLVFDVFFFMQNICSFFVFVWFYLYFLISEAFLDLYNLNVSITRNASSLRFKNLLEVFLMYLLFHLFCLNLSNIWTDTKWNCVSASYRIRIYWITVPFPPPHVMWYSPHTNW